MPVPPANTRRVLLGLFVVWQLLFMVGTNLNDLLSEAQGNIPPQCLDSLSAIAPDWPNNRGRLVEASHSWSDLSSKYIYLTGQEQIWALFSSGWQDSGFVAVELRWDGAAPALLLSENEPASVESYFRWGRLRTRRVESHFEFFSADDADRRQAIAEHVRARNAAMLAYLQWQLRHYRQSPESAEPVPRQVIMLFRRYHTRNLDGAWPKIEGPFTLPLACWRPEAPVEPGYLPVEAYDPETDQFVRLKSTK